MLRSGALGLVVLDIEPNIALKHGYQTLEQVLTDAARPDAVRAPDWPVPNLN